MPLQSTTCHNDTHRVLDINEIIRRTVAYVEEMKKPSCVSLIDLRGRGAMGCRCPSRWVFDHGIMLLVESPPKLGSLHLNAS